MKLLTTLQAAEILELSPRSLQRYRQFKKGPSWIKLGGRVFYTEADLTNWINHNRQLS